MADPFQSRGQSLPRVYDEGWTVGKLIAHGKAYYPGNPQNELSYYIRLQALETEQGAWRRHTRADQATRPIDGHTPQLRRTAHDGGVIERWGRDLERAIRESKSHVEIGQIVAAKIIARESISSHRSTESKDAKKPAYWNRWEVERVQYVAQRNRFAHAVNENRRNARRDGVEGNEALALYLIQEGAERLAAVRYPNAQDRKAFVESVKNFLARSPERERLIADAVARIKARLTLPTPQARDRDPRREGPTQE